MEAVPRLPMISFEMLVCTKKISFTHKIEKYISGYYHEDPSSYHTEVQALEALRISAVWPSVDINACQAMKKYYCQLHYMKSRFPMEENQPVALQFSWKDEYTKMSCTVPDVGFEEMCILFNIGALHSKLGAADSRSTPDGMKMACTHFQCAAWCFQAVREQYAQYVGVVIANVDIVRAMELLCLAQAQECILEKSLLDNRKAAVVVKVAAELSNFYFKAHKLLVAGDDVMLYEHLPQNKFLVRYVQFKIAHYRCVSLLYAGQQAEEQQQMGARVAYYQAALDALEEARGCIGRMPGGSQQQALFSDTITFTWDVVEGKRKAAVNENEFIYHEEVPQVTGPGFELNGASLVKGIPFNVTDVEVSGPDIFARLIPMVAHEASSIYSEQKASLLRYVADDIDKVNQQLQDFMSAINVDFLTEIKSVKGLTQELVDRAADMNARPEAVKELVEMMSKLSDAYHEVESLLSEINQRLEKEEQAEAEYQSIMGKRPQSNVLTELRRETAKYQEAHSRASESNDALHKAMTSHVANLKILAQPLSKLQEVIPKIILPDNNIDDEALQKFEIILAKVEEMKTQRSTLWAQFREEMHKDDITPLLVTTNLDMDELFKTEMKKHKKFAELIKQNIVAQENIKNALTNSYAALNDSRKYIENILHKRNATIAALSSSYDTYGDLQAKAQKGIEFYTKLEENVTKLYQRVRSTCTVQQEEREQLLTVAVGSQRDKTDTSSSTRKGPKLKDYLDTRKASTSANEVGTLDANNPMYGNLYGAYGSGIQPAPFGLDSVTSSSKESNESTLLNRTDMALNHNLTSRMAQLNVAQQRWQESPGVSATPAYDHIPENQHNPVVTVVDSMYNVSNMATNSNVPNHSYNSTNIAHNTSRFNSSLPTSNVAQVSLNNSTKIADTSMYSYSTVFGTGTTIPATNPNINPEQLQMLPKQQINVPCNVFQSNNADQVPNTYNLYSSGYTQIASNNSENKTPSLSVNASGTGNIYNSVGYVHEYPGYNTQQTSATAVSYDHFNSSAMQQGVLYNTTSVRPNYPVISSNNYYTQPINQEQNASYRSGNNVYSTVANQYNHNHSINTTSASIVPQNQPLQYTPSLQYNAGNLPLSSTQTTTTTSTAVSPNAMSSQGTSSGYASSRYENADVAPIKSHATGHFSTDSQNYYGQQATSNYYSNYMCQTTAGYNYYNYSQTHPKQSQSLISPNHQTSNNSCSSHEVQDIKKVSSIDLLSGLDFSINQAPLVPQKEQPPAQMDPAVTSTCSPKQLINSISKPEIVNVAIHNKLATEKPPKKEPFRSSAIVTNFTTKAREFWIFTDSLAVDKALNILWKDVQDGQESLNAKNKSISVARCYPLKNRCPDILPYDYNRVELLGAKDDYINASKVYDIHEYVPNCIITQIPLKSTFTDFWDMIWEQDVETVVCLLSDSEMGSDIYWPILQNNDLNIGNKVLTLLNTHIRAYSTERKISIHIPEKRETKHISLYQFTAWSGSVIPPSAEAFLAFVHDVLAEYDTQKSHLNPILVHCNSGVGRSGCFCTVISVMGEVNSTGQCADVKKTISLLSAMRKNILRDREHLKFAYNTIALFYKGLIKVHNSSSMEKFDPIIMEEHPAPEAVKVDPLSYLDPLWVTKK